MNIDFKAIHNAVTLLSEGKLVAVPTETVYGLGGDARNIDAIQKIFRVKNRPPSNPLIIHLSHISAIQDYARNIPEAAFHLAKCFWPGPLTLVLPKHPSVLPIVTGGQDSVALRIPNHPVALALIEAFGRGIAAPSANRSGMLSPTCKEHVQQGLGSLVDFILEGGPCTVGIESTIVSLLDEQAVILRQGHILEADIANALGYATLPKHSKTKIETPGSQFKHYAPQKPLFLLNTSELKIQIRNKMEQNIPCAVLSFSLKQNDIEQITTSWIQLSDDPENYAQGLYAALHELDRTEASCILVEMPPQNAAWLAVLDRLQRASAT